MNPREITISHHFTADRQERLHQINWVLLNNWGIGCYKAWDTKNNSWIHITTTGLFVITNADESCIVTMYIPSISQAYQLFRNINVKMPYELKKRIHENYVLAREYEENFFKESA